METDASSQNSYEKSDPFSMSSIQLSGSMIHSHSESSEIDSDSESSSNIKNGNELNSSTDSFDMTESSENNFLEESDCSESSHISLEDLRIYKEKKVLIAKKAEQLQQSPLFQSFFQFVHSALRLIPHIQKNNSLHNNAGVYSFGLDSYIDAEKLNLGNALVEKNFNRLAPLYSNEIHNLEGQMKQSLEQLDSIESLIKCVRPLALGEHDIKSDMLQRKFLILMSHQRSNACDYLLEARKMSGESRPVKEKTAKSRSNSNKGRGRRVLPKEHQLMINDWFEKNKISPFPNEDEKVLLGTIVNLSKTQVENWFGNKRVRVKKSNLKTAKKSRQSKKI